MRSLSVAEHPRGDRRCRAASAMRAVEALVGVDEVRPAARAPARRSASSARHCARARRAAPRSPRAAARRTHELLDRERAPRRARASTARWARSGAARPPGRATRWPSPSSRRSASRTGVRLVSNVGGELLLDEPLPSGRSPRSSWRAARCRPGRRGRLARRRVLPRAARRAARHRSRGERSAAASSRAPRRPRRRPRSAAA